jgi:hypothetical protein
VSNQESAQSDQQLVIQASPPSRRRLVLSVSAAVLLCSWLAVLVVGAADSWVVDPVVSAVTILIGFLIFHTIASPFVVWSSTRCQLLLSSMPSLVLFHVATACFVVSQRLSWSSSSSSLMAEVPREVGRAVAVYVALLVIFAHGSWLSYQDRRVATADAELREMRVQQSYLRSMLLTDGEEEDEEASELLEGDEREHLIVAPNATLLSELSIGHPDLVFTECLAGAAFDRALGLQMASRLRRRDYSLAHFYSDVRTCFPELELYLACKPVLVDNESASERDGVAPAVKKSGTTSGLTTDAEYRRTIGALFAVYWLMRIGIDGERGFSFGVDEAWKPREVPDPPARTQDLALASLEGSGVAAVEEDKVEQQRRAETQKRLSFYENQDWGRLQDLIADSGMISVDKQGGVTIDAERTLAMLALTAFHDVMKVEALLPAIAPEHAPYLGFKAGETINDHDIALGYVLDHYSHVLPSFTGLTADNRKSVRFTQSKMAFNHGWLVQGEAPPAPLFAPFKEVLVSGGAEPADVAFYFVHWLTDLAGAEPSPLGGGEKFVLKFPHAVLDSFIRSFSVLNELAHLTETQVFEKYLVRTWGETRGPLPLGEGAIALLRLSLQAQTPEKQGAVIAAFDALPSRDRATLASEMARTGISEQQYHRGPSFSQVQGPAFLIYYSPAFLRNWAPVHAKEALMILAEVYRRSRELWPLTPTSGNAHAVTIRIDQLKELKLSSILSVFSEGDAWAITRKNDNEGVVERDNLASITARAQDGTPCVVLKFHRVNKDMSGRSAKSKMTTSSALSRLSHATNSAKVAPAAGPSAS